MTLRAPGISVVIPTHDRLALLQRALAVILADEACAEVVVVADDCSDGTDEYLLQLAAQESKVHLVLLHPGAGAALARREGFSAASSDIVLCLDDDVVPTPGLVSGHAEAHQDLVRHVVLGYMPTRVPAPLRRGMYATREYSETYEWEVAEFEKDPEKILSRFWAGNFSVRRTDFLRAAMGFEPSVRYHEDLELGLRLRASGLRAIFLRSLRGDHIHSRSWSAYLREGASQGESRAVLSRSYPTSVTCDPWLLSVDENPVVRTIVGVARFPGVGSPLIVLLRLATWVTGAIGLLALERKLARVAKDITWHRSASAAVMATDARGDSSLPTSSARAR